MRIPINLLSTRLREEPIQVPAHPWAREYGVATVILREIEGDRFDDLWDAVALTEREISQLRQAPSRDVEALHKAKAKYRAACAAVIDACVVGHNPDDFSVQVPQEPPTSSLGLEFITMLVRLGFTEAEATDALVTGLARKPFIAGQMAEFYAKCQPNKRFLLVLLRFIKLFQSCDTPTPEREWKENGVEVPQSPLPATQEATT